MRARGSKFSWSRGDSGLSTEGEMYPSRSTPASMHFQDPLHLPYGTAERETADFWGTPLFSDDPNMHRTLLPTYATAEFSWDNPRENAFQNTTHALAPYQTPDGYNMALGAEMGRSVDVREQSLNRYVQVVQKTNQVAYNADPLYRSGGSGGGVPVLGSYMGKRGQQKPSSHPAYVPPAGGSLPNAPHPEADTQLPSATRSLGQNEYMTTGISASRGVCGNESTSPQVGGRYSQLSAVDYNSWGHRNGGFVRGGVDTETKGETLWNPSIGARYRNVTAYQQNAAVLPIGVKIPVVGGPSLENNPQVGGRWNQKANFEMAPLFDRSGVAQGASETHNPRHGGRSSKLAALSWEAPMGPAGISHGVSSSLSNNPQNGGRPGRILPFTMSSCGGVSKGVGTDPSLVPQQGGRTSQLINFDITMPAGKLSGVGSSIELNDPAMGAWRNRLFNWDVIMPGGISSGISGLDVNNIIGGQRLPKTEGVVGMIPQITPHSNYYGGIDFAFGIEESPRHKRTLEPSISIAGSSTGRGSIISPDLYITSFNTQLNSNGVVDTTPDPALQISTRRAPYTQNILDFSAASLNELAIDSRVC